ncbi:MAG: response regulator [Deltaproteobacteria bacterium]|nr:response regulator [Deltaproteobacteria bacterium]
MISITAFIVFSAAICMHVAFLGVLYAWENSRTTEKLRTTFLTFLVWIVGEFISGQIQNVEWRLWIQRATGAMGFLAAITFTRFAYALRYKKYDRTFYAFVFAIACCGLMYLITDWGIAEVYNRSRMHMVRFGFMLWPILTVVLGTWAFNSWVMFQAMLELPDYESARRAAIVQLQLATTVLSLLGIFGFIWSSIFWEISLFFRYVPLLSTVFIPFFLVAFYRFGFLTTGIEQLARDLFENAQDGIIVTDKSHIVRQINPMALQLLNLESEQAERKPLKHILNLPKEKEHSDGFDLSPSDIPGLQHFLSVSVTPVTSHMEVQQHLVILHDVTDEKAAEEAASKSKEDFEQEILQRTEELIELQEKEAVGAMAGSIAHDFNNLLAAVLGFGTAAHQDLPDDSPLKKDLEEILASARRARAVVHQLLLFSRRQKSRRMRLDAAELLQSALPLVTTSLPPSINLSHAIPNSPIHVMANRTDLSQVLMNLCTNAIQAMGDTVGTISISLEIDAICSDNVLYVGEHVGEKNVRMAVRDGGPGISDSMKSLVFEPFFSTRETAIGFGLSTALRIATENGGGISIEDNTPAGAVVSIWLPRLDLSDVKENDDDTIELSGGEHVLLVDDDTRLLKLMERFLSSAGYIVTAVDEPQAALSAFRRTPGAFDIVVTDYVMPHMSGIELGALLLEERNDLPVLLISGNATETVVATAREEGIDNYLEKPFSREMLLGSVRCILNQYARPSVIP